MSNITLIPSHFEVIKSNLIYQFKGKENLEELLGVFANEIQELEQVFYDLLTKRSIDTAVGEQLDIIGEIVGQPRLVDDITTVFFGFQGATPSPGGFGGTPIVDGDTPGIFRSHGQGTGASRALSDSEYRIAIRGKIWRNISKGTPDDLIEQLKSQLVSPEMTIEENPSGDDAKVRIGIGRVLTSTENQLVATQENLATPTGVEVEFFEYTP